jgi:hypothetical protein
VHSGTYANQAPCALHREGNGMNRRHLYLVVLGGFLAWIAIAEILDGNIFLGLNTIAGALLIVASPWLYVMRDDDPNAPELFPQAGVDTPLPSTSTLADAYPAGVRTTEAF